MGGVTDFSRFVGETFNSFPAGDAHCKRESEGPEQQWQAGLHIEEVMDNCRDDVVCSVASLRFQSSLDPRRVFTWTPHAVPPLRVLCYSLHPYTFPKASKDGHACASTPPAATAGTDTWGALLAPRPGLEGRCQAGPPAPSRARVRAVAVAAELLHRYREKQPQRRGSIPCQKGPCPPGKLKALGNR